MNIAYFEGAAGTGKTYSLIESLKNQVHDNPLKEHQKVLALTFMHGSRRRLENRLFGVDEIGNKFDCQTFDSFAWEIVQRWRDLLVEIKDIEKDILTNKYEKNCLEASELLRKNCVQKWVSQTYPLIIIDEVQDLSDSRFKILRGLSNNCTLFVAGDLFQNLDVSNDSSKFLEWLRKNSKYENLTKVERTNDVGILRVSSNLRNGDDFISLLTKDNWGLCLESFRLISVPSWQMMAWHLGFQFHRYKSQEIAILTLSNSESVVENALSRVKTERQNLNKKKNLTFGPFPDIVKVKRNEDFANDCLQSVGAQESNAIDDLINNCNKIEEKSLRISIQNWLIKRKKLGHSECTKVELFEKILSLSRNQRIYSRTRKNNKHVLTIHQAKNREFSHVVVLWTFGISADASTEYQRRLLYNAITRAKLSCTVILLQSNRLKKPPFAVS